jgi:hypothetical protein
MATVIHDALRTAIMARYRPNCWPWCAPIEPFDKDDHGKTKSMTIEACG